MTSRFLILAAALALASCGDTVRERAATGALGGGAIGYALGGPVGGAVVGGTVGAFSR